MGDVLQDLICEHFHQFIAERAKNYTVDFARRAMQDLAFEDYEDFYHVVDVKTHRLSGSFSMPNLISVERLARFYESDKNIFVILMVQYDIDNQTAQVRNVHFVPIEYLRWDCLTLGALGWGQIQIRNANHLSIDPTQSRKTWMLQLLDALDEFYPREIAKIQDRLSHFQKIRQFWASRPD